MNLKLNKEEIGVYILRLGLAVVFLYFGISQILDQSKWIYFVPDRFSNFYISEILKSKIVFLNGIFDTIIALSLISGLFIRIFSFLGFIHLFSITIFSLGFEPSGIRDLGLAFAMLSLFFFYLVSKIKI
jgi:uncharacterized membrane protein YphA (DoxX/SURF4 family)